MAKNRHQITLGERILVLLVVVIVIFSVAMFAVGWRGIRPSRAADPEFIVWGSVTYDSAKGPPVPGVVVRCNRVVGGAQIGVPSAYPGLEGQYILRFTGEAEQLRIWVELPESLKVIGNSTCSPCGPWGINLIACDRPSRLVGPVRFFVGFVFLPTRTPTATPPATPTVTVPATPAEIPTETPYLLPTALPKDRPTPATHLECRQRQIEQNDELIAILRYAVFILAGALAGAGYVTIQSKRS